MIDTAMPKGSGTGCGPASDARAPYRLAERRFRQMAAPAPREASVAGVRHPTLRRAGADTPRAEEHHHA